MDNRDFSFKVKPQSPTVTLDMTTSLMNMV